MITSPPTPAVDLPPTILTVAPLVVPVLSPAVTEIAPPRPDEPAALEISTSPPLAPAPLDRTRLPPCAPVDAPAAINSSAPLAEALLPGCTSMDPAVLPVASAVFTMMFPEETPSTTEPVDSMISPDDLAVFVAVVTSTPELPRITILPPVLP